MRTVKIFPASVKTSRGDHKKLQNKSLIKKFADHVKFNKICSFQQLMCF